MSKKSKQKSAPGASVGRKAAPSVRAIAEAPPLPSFRPCRTFWALFAVAALVRLLMLGRHGLYMDEVLNLLDARRGLDYIFTTWHPLHFLLLRPFVSLSSSEFALRLMPALFSLAGLLVMFWIGRAAGGGRLPLTLAALWVCSQYVTFYSLDANYYAEMMTWTALAVWGALMLLRYGRLWGGLVAVASGAAMMLVHPFSGLFSGPLMGFIVIAALAWREPRREVLDSIRRSWRGHRGAFVAAIVVIGGVAGFAAVRYGGRLWRFGMQFLGQFEFASWAHNLDFNFYFFSSTFRAYGPSLIQDGAGAAIAGVIVFGMFLAGLVILFRAKSPLALIVAGSFIVTFAMIFNTGINRFYHIRYTSYLVPLYLISCGAALATLGDWLEGRLGKSKRAFGAPEAAVAAVIAALFLPFTLHLMAGPYASWKLLQRELEREFTRQSQLYIFYHGDREISEYYLERAGFDPKQIVFPNQYHDHLRPLALFDLKRQLVKNPDTWYVSHWTEFGTVHAPLMEWVEKNFDLAVAAPSRHEISLIKYYAPDRRKTQRDSAPHQLARLFRWKYPNRFLFHPYPLEMAVAGEEGPVTLLVDRAGTYTVELMAGDAVAGWVSVGGARHGLVERSGRLAADVWLNDGEQVFEFENRASSDSPPDSEIRVNIFPAMASNPVTIHPFAVDGIQPTQSLHVDKSEASPALGLRRNGFVRYAFYAPEDGDYEIRIYADHDQPGPILIGAAIDGTPEGVLAYDANDDLPGVKRLRALLDRGIHALTLFFLNETPDDKAPAETNRDAVIRSIEIASAADSSSGSDDRMALAGAMLRPTENYKGPWASIWPPGATPRLNPNWVMNFDKKTTIADAVEIEGEQAIVLEIGPKSTGGLVGIPPLPVNGAKFVFASVEIKCEDLENHSANIMIVYANAAGQPIGSRLVNTQGITGDTDWIPFAVFDPIPPGTVAVTFGASVYQNSRRRSPDAGKVYARRFGVHALE